MAPPIHSVSHLTPDPSACRTHSPADDGDASNSEAAAAGEAASLEYFQNVVTAQDQSSASIIEVAKCGCDCWFCEDCCKRKGYNLRADLIPILETFTGLMMLTLTIDPELFTSPRQAYLYVRKRRAIGVLIQTLYRARHLNTRRYISIIEFQKHTEQVHFHLLVDATRIPKHAIDAAWSKNRPSSAGRVAENRPAFGMTRFSVGHFEGGALHAARYATKYLVKIPEHGFPEWVMSMGAEHRVPRYSVSRGFWNRSPKPSRPPQSARELPPRSYRERLKDCGVTCNLFRVMYHWRDSIGQPTRQRKWLSRIGMDANILSAIVGLGSPSPRRALMPTNALPNAIELLQQAAGHPIRIISGAGTNWHHPGREEQATPPAGGKP